MNLVAENGSHLIKTQKWIRPGFYCKELEKQENLESTDLRRFHCPK
jgi:hypothetical protein